jgi:PAS domain S-box-containing protein
MPLTKALTTFRRASLGVLAVIAVAVAVLGLLVAQTSRHSIDGARMNVAGRQRMLSERLVALTLLARNASPEERLLWRPRIDATVSELREASQQLRSIGSGDVVIPPDTKAAEDYENLIWLQDSVKETSMHLSARPDAPAAEIDALLSQQKRLAVAIAHVVDELESEWGRQVDNLLLLEAACVILLLIAMVLGVRLASQPTQTKLEATIQALGESESRNRAVLEAMPDGLIIVSASGEYLGANASALKLYELPPDTPIAKLGEMRSALGDASGRPIETEHLPSRITLASGLPLSDEVLTLRLRDGSLRYLSVNTRPLYRGESKLPSAVVVLFRDVTLQRRADEELIAQAQALEMQNQELLAQADQLERGQSLFRSLVETAGSAIVGLDPEGRVFEWNREAEILFGVARPNAIGRSYVSDFVPREEQARMKAAIANSLHGQPIRNLVAAVKSAGGERHTVLWNISPMRVGAGQPVHGLIAAGLDISEREASEERFRLLFERSSDAHMLYDASGIIDCNDATLRMLRVSGRERLVGRRPADLSPMRQPDGRLSVVVAGQMREKARATGHHRFEWVHRRDDGTEFPVEVTLTPLRLHGRDVILAVWHDIAERKAVEEALRQAKDAAESANRTKSDFMTRMNHELRTPLTAIIGFSRVMLQGRAGELSEGAQLYAQRIRDNGMHLLSLINQILDVAKVEAGRMELDREVVDVAKLVGETVAMLESNAEAKGLKVLREIPDSMAPTVTDPGKLRQILINLIGNAIKFTTEGLVTVRVVADPITRYPRQIIIVDTGVGIPEDRREKIFEPFEQGESYTRRQFGGTGLGLSIVKSFAELIGATITVDSQVGVGSIFTLSLPVAAGETLESLSLSKEKVAR